MNNGLTLPRKAVAIVSLCLGGITLMMDSAIAGFVLPTIAAELKIPHSEAVIIVTTYQLILVMSLMPLAALGERIGQRRLYCTGLVIHIIAALACFLAENLPTLLAARALQALGTATSLSVAFGMVRAIYPPEQLGRGMSINTLANASGVALAPVISGVILSVAGWQWVFSAAVPFALLSLILFSALPQPLAQIKPFDVTGAALCALTFGLLIGGMELIIHGSIPELGVLVLLLGLSAALVFYRHETLAASPVLPVDLLSNAKLALALFANFNMVAASMVLILFMPFKLQIGYSFAPAEIGSILAAYPFASVVISPLAGYLSDRIPVSVLCFSGLLVTSAGLFSLLSLAPPPTQPEPFQFAWRLWVCGAGFGMFLSSNARFVIGAAPANRAASVGSMLTTTRMLSQATGASLFAGLLALEWGDSMKPVLACFGLIALSSVIYTLSVTGKRELSKN